MFLKLLSVIIILFVSFDLSAVSQYERQLYLGIRKQSKKGARYFTKSIANLRASNMRSVEKYRTKLCRRTKKSKTIKKACLYLSREISKKVKRGKSLKVKINSKKIIKNQDKKTDKELSKKFKKKFKSFKKETVEGNIRIVEECKRYFCFKTKYINDKRVFHEIYDNKN